jgi:hypothetical protein
LTVEAERIYRELCLVADRLGVVVAERDLQGTSPPVKSGICKTGGRYMVVIDKTEPLSSRIDLLASCLNRMDLDNVYLIPAIRGVLESHKESVIKSGMKNAREKGCGH